MDLCGDGCPCCLRWSLDRAATLEMVADLERIAQRLEAQLASAQRQIIDLACW